MSGGKEKKASRSKAQGWEEAGSEFYQERYPGDTENIHRDPSKLATLLPSKQTRVGKFKINKPKYRELNFSNSSRQIFNNRIE